MARYRIEVTPSAARTLQGVSASTTQDVRQMLQGVAELASLYPLEAPLWSRLGKVAGTTLELDVSGQTLQVVLQPARKVVRLVAVTSRRMAPARPQRGTARRALTVAAMAPALPRRRRARAELYS